MSFLERFLNNHVLANLTFGLVLVIGFLSYLDMPRAKDPEINFNWVNITTFLPGASSKDVEKRITDPLEDTIRSTIQDIRFISSTSRAGISNILIRFNQLDERTFDKRLNNLRREVQNAYNDQLPDQAEDPFIFEVTTSNAYPSASIAITSAGDDENLRRQTRNIKKDLERVKGVDRINDLGLNDPELHIKFYPERLEGLGITPADLTDTVRSYFRDVSAGDVKTDDGQWIVRIEGTNTNPDTLADYPVVTADGIVPLGNLAELSRSTEEPSEIVRFNGEPATLLAITKQSTTNVLELVD
ncbi:MAG: efflux RND transporter permease subunit, partial [Gammaproteobacteria bacterium]